MRKLRIYKIRIKLVVPETVSEKGYKETVQVAESTILVVSKVQSRICNESLLDKAYCIYWIIEFRTFFSFVEGGCDRTQRIPRSDDHGYMTKFHHSVYLEERGSGNCMASISI